MKYILKKFNSIIFIAFAILVFFLTDSHAYDDETLKLLNNIDIKLDELSETIRNDSIGWLDLEILNSSRTNKFQRKYINLNTTLTPIITEHARLVRYRVTNLQTMGDSVANLPSLLSEYMTIAIYQDKLNHIEFLLLSRQSTISSKLSIWIAFLFSVLSIIISIILSRKHTPDEKAKSANNNASPAKQEKNNPPVITPADKNNQKEALKPLINDSISKKLSIKESQKETIADNKTKKKKPNNSLQAIPPLRDTVGTRPEKPGRPPPRQSAAG